MPDMQNPEIKKDFSPEAKPEVIEQSSPELGHNIENATSDLESPVAVEVPVVAPEIITESPVSILASESETQQAPQDRLNKFFKGYDLEKMSEEAAEEMESLLS